MCTQIEDTGGSGFLSAREVVQLRARIFTYQRSKDCDFSRRCGKSSTAQMSQTLSQRSRKALRQIGRAKELQELHRAGNTQAPIRSEPATVQVTQALTYLEGGRVWSEDRCLVSKPDLEQWLCRPTESRAAARACRTMILLLWGIGDSSYWS